MLRQLKNAAVTTTPAVASTHGEFHLLGFNTVQLQVIGAIVALWVLLLLMILIVRKIMKKRKEQPQDQSPPPPACYQNRGRGAYKGKRPPAFYNSFK